MRVAGARSRDQIEISPLPAHYEQAVSSWDLIREFAFSDRREWLVICLLGAMAVLLSLTLPWPAKIIVDSVIGSAPVPTIVQPLIDWAPYASSARGTLVAMAIASVMLFILHAITDSYALLRWVKHSQNMAFRLGTAVFSRLQRRSLLFHTKTPVGDSISRITGDAWSIHSLVERVLFSPYQALLMMLGAGYVLFQLDRQLALFVLIIAPATVTASLAFGGRIRATAHTQREVEAAVQGHLQRALSNVPLIQGFLQEKRQANTFRLLADDAIRIQRRGALLNTMNELSSGLITATGAALVFWLAAHKVLDGTLSLGAMLIFMAYLQTLQAQLKSLSGIYAAAQQAGAGLDRIAALLSDGPEIVDSPDAVMLRRVTGQIQLHHVSAGYDQPLPVLRDVSLDIEEGEIVALIGPSGAGKSTLVGLLPRFLDPWSGSVTLDGLDLRKIRLESLRRNIAVVAQEPVLLATTVIANISSGNPEASFDEVVDAAKLAQAHEFIQELEAGYLTLIRDGGASLSGGQRQRISIARALLTGAPILVLDEPTSALDSETELAFVDALRGLRGKRTIVIIAHRMSTAAVADRVVVLRGGQIVGEGPPSAILSMPELTGDAEWANEATK